MKEYFCRLVICMIILVLSNEYVFQFDFFNLIRFLFVMILISFPFAVYDWLKKDNK